MTIKCTGIFLTDEQLGNIVMIMKPKIIMDIEKGITITTPGDMIAAMNLLNKYAVEHGLPKINGYYGLTEDGEIVAEVAPSLTPNAEMN